MTDDTAPKLNGPDLRSGVAIESLAENLPLLGHVDAELAYLTLAVIAINGWNRLNVAFRTSVPAQATVGGHS